MEKKKTDSANLELRRREMMLVALVVVLSCFYAAVGWDTSLSPRLSEELMEDALESIDLDRLKRDRDMVAAIARHDTPQETVVVKPGERLTVQPEAEPAGQPVAGDDAAADEDTPDADTPQPPAEPVAADLPEEFRVVEALPEFPGGASAFMKWITANLRYPQAAQNRRLEGKVVVSFIVDIEGNVTHLKVESSPDVLFTQEVVKVMSRMPRWTPGVQHGKPCATMVAVPIHFDM